MLKSEIMNKPFRLLGWLWSWLTVNAPKKYTARLVAQVGRGNGYEGLLGAVFEGEDGRAFYASIGVWGFQEDRVEEILPKDFTPALIDALNGKFGEPREGWILDVTLSRESEPITDTTIIEALKWAWHPYPKVEEKPYKPLEGEDLERGLAMTRPYLEEIRRQCGLPPRAHNLA
ncbi:MAG: hypothetical protein FWF24_04820 [Alphaproteobacteria bacterium]|nr:hypothetical protein [Alphaproteobacteria bacterium]